MKDTEGCSRAIRTLAALIGPDQGCHADHGQRGWRAPKPADHNTHGAEFGGDLWFLTHLGSAKVDELQGIALLLVGAAYFAYDFLAHSRDTRPADVAEAGAIERDVVAGHAWLLTGRGTAVQFMAGAVMVVAGSRLLVDAAVGLATALAVPSLVVGLTMVALGTSLPELVTAVSSARRGVSDLGIGNVVGANVANLSLVPGAAASIAPIGIDRAEQLFNMTAMLAVMALVAFLIVWRGRISRQAGAGLLALYAMYLAGLTVLSAVRP